MKTVIILAHPDFAASRVNRAMAEGVAEIEGVQILDLYARYPNGKINYEAEKHALLATDRLVLQFPLQWYSTPALLKEWEDIVLTRLAYNTELAATTHGLPVMVATTTGGDISSYVDGSQHGYTLEGLLAPLHATVQKCGWVWHSPFAIHGIRKLSNEELMRSVDEYKKIVSDVAWTSSQ